MQYLNWLLENNQFDDALDYLSSYFSEDDEEYLFYLAFIQIHKGWDIEAIQTLGKYQIKYPDSLNNSTMTGFLADILHNNGQLYDAAQEIVKALQSEPDCPLIQSKAEEIFSDLDNLLNGIKYFMLICGFNRVQSKLN